MKRGTPNHPKTHRLAEELGVSWATTVGHLELLFHFAGHYTPNGDIGRYGEKRLAGAMGWKGKPSKLIEALVTAGWVDRHSVATTDQLGSNSVATLQLHDWSEHADRAVKKRIAKTRKMISLRIQEDTSNECDLDESDTKPKSVLPVPVPVKVQHHAPAPVPPSPPDVKIKPPSARKRTGAKEPDPRHIQFREQTAKYWQLKNSDREMPWNGQSAKALADLLAANPLLDVDTFTELLRNRWKSDLNHFEAPAIWLRRITDFAGGPLDRFGQPMNGAGGKRHGKGHTIIDAVKEAKRIGREIGMAGGDGTAQGRLGD